MYIYIYIYKQTKRKTKKYLICGLFYFLASNGNFERIYPHIHVQMIGTGYCFRTDHVLCRRLNPSEGAAKYLKLSKRLCFKTKIC